jgi:hypothetical protein
MKKPSKKTPAWKGVIPRVIEFLTDYASATSDKDDEPVIMKKEEVLQMVDGLKKLKPHLQFASICFTCKWTSWPLAPGMRAGRVLGGAIKSK